MNWKRNWPHWLVEKDLITKSKMSPLKESQAWINKLDRFSAEAVANTVSVKNIFEYGLTFARFLLLVTFLCLTSDVIPVEYQKIRKAVQNMDVSDQLFLVLCRLRNGLHIKDLAYRFNIKQQCQFDFQKCWYKHIYSW